MSFKKLGLDDWLIQALDSLSIKAPSEIQENCIPAILRGEDVIGSAKTGSGKTAAFALPILQKLSEDPFGVFCLVLTPTRELAFQIAEQFRILGSSIGLKQSVIVGGLEMMKQAIELAQKPHIVVATPGRLADHIQSNANAIHFKRIKYLVMDEADRLLDDSFTDNLQVILDCLPKKRQTLLFSATMSPEIESLEFGSKPPFVYSCATRYDTVSQLDQRYLFVPSGVRESYLVYLLLNDLTDKSIIIFAAKPRACEIIRIILREMGLRSTALHAQMTQNERLSSLAKFKGGIVPILISTDVGSRGLDIPTVEAVVNYDLPADATDYVHRIGRTARAGRGGMAISIVTERDIQIVLNIEEKTQKKMTELEVPEKAVLELLNQVNLAKREASTHLLNNDFGSQKRIQNQKSGKVFKKVKK
ncbi:P-loop containing nucleoside triphosphate hydrolase protein [Globomyces pollinis-pini]|nr:P-loop containing nucleoside triphosphate hydrolase protein [Globomyces pollinis-pini]